MVLRCFQVVVDYCNLRVDGVDWNHDCVLRLGRRLRRAFLYAIKQGAKEESKRVNEICGDFGWNVELVYASARFPRGTGNPTSNFAGENGELPNFLGQGISYSCENADSGNKSRIGAS